jgi:hypothetical protein
MSVVRVKITGKKILTYHGHKGELTDGTMGEWKGKDASERGVGALVGAS